MSLRILHTADNHIGPSFNQYPEAARGRLMDERFASLERLVATANHRQANFIVVAGDLFDKTTVTKAQIERVVKMLGKFEGESVLVLAGNHDFCRPGQQALETIPHRGGGQQRAGLDRARHHGLRKRRVSRPFPRLPLPE